jgi:hypothetical protein
MKFTRLRLLVVILVGCVATGLLLLWFGYRNQRWLGDEEETFSLIEDGLYMGGSVNHPPPGTDAVFNLCKRDDPYRTEVYFWKAIPDSAPAPPLDWLRRLVKSVDANRQAGRTVYVHCYKGVSRSGLLTTAYLMYKNHWGRDRALAFVRSRRPEAKPNPAFMDLLLDWEREVKEQSAEGES